jgi:TatD DNase family protein
MNQSFKLVDTHAHLYSGEFDKDIEEVLGRAKDAGVAYIICPGTDIETSRRSIEIAEKYPIIYAAVGIHPHDARKADASAFDKLEELSHHPKVVAIGEIGLDYHYNYSPPEIQKETFSRQITIAQRRNLPIIIHSREAEEDVINILETKVKDDPKWRSVSSHPVNRYPSPKGVFHCFPGDSKMAWKVIEMGFYISLTGPVTYGGKPNKPNLMEEVAKNVSAEHILLETDCPYLAPVPFRGKRNEPSYIKYIAEKIASLQGLFVEDIVRASAFGAHRLFGVGKYPAPAITYQLRNSLYLNITIRCNADCVFCDRKGDAVIKGYNLRITNEPGVQQIIESIGDPLRYDEIVFCGYGEPTIRLEVLKEVSKWVKSRGGKVRLNTDGHGNAINARNIVPELVGIVDSVSISLNTTDPVQYGKIMQIDEKKFFPAMVEFARECVRYKLDVTLTIVDIEGVDDSKAREFVEKEIGAKFKKRPFF